MPLLHLSGTSKPTPTQLYEYSRIGTPVKLACAVSLLMTLTLVALANMNQKKSSTQQRTSDYQQRLVRPNPPTPEMVQRAQPFRGDTLKELEAVIKNPQNLNGY